MKLIKIISKTLSSPIYLEVQSFRVLKHWQKVRVELSGEGAGYDVTRGYNQVKVKTAIRNQLPQLRTLPPLSLSPSTLWSARACWSNLGRNSCAQQLPAALHDIIIIIPLLSPPIIYCRRFVKTHPPVMMWLSTFNTAIQDLTLAFEPKRANFQIALMVCE